MDKRRVSTSRSRPQQIVHTPLVLPAISGSGVSSDGSQQQSPGCEHQHHHRNNHNSGLIQFDDVPKSTTGRRRRTTMSQNENECSHHHRSHTQFGFIPAHLHDAFVILLRLIILFAAILIVGFSLYHAIIYVYPKPKKTGWDRVWFSMIDWLVGD